MSTLAIIGTCIPILLLIVSLLVFFVKSVVEKAILEANAKQLIQINGTYVRSAGSKITGFQIEQLHSGGAKELIELKADIKVLSDYAHKSVHDLRNMVQMKQGIQDLLDELLDRAKALQPAPPQPPKP